MREKERERNISVWLPLTRPLLGTWPATEACALTGNRTSDPLVHRPVLNPLSHTSQGNTTFLKIHPSYCPFPLRHQRSWAPLASPEWAEPRNMPHEVSLLPRVIEASSEEGEGRRSDQGPPSSYLDVCRRCCAHLSITVITGCRGAQCAENRGPDATQDGPGSNSSVFCTQLHRACGVGESPHTSKGFSDSRC